MYPCPRTNHLSSVIFLIFIFFNLQEREEEQQRTEKGTGSAKRERGSISPLFNILCMYSNLFIEYVV